MLYRKREYITKTYPVNCKNILVDEKGHFWLIDFGIAEKIRDDEVTWSYNDDLNVYETSLYNLLDYKPPSDSDSDYD